MLENVRQTGFNLPPKTCNFTCEGIRLGHKISNKGIHPDQSKVRAVSNFPVPTTVKNLQSFLGLANFYRKFIPNFANLGQPLYKLVKKDTPFHWTEEQQTAFQSLKDSLATAPVLRYFNPQATRTELRTDASRTGVGAVLLQKSEDDAEMHPVAFVSRTLSAPEKNYTVSELEFLAVIWSLESLKHLVWGQPVAIVTDHSALTCLKSSKAPVGRLCRWSLRLAEFDYTIEYKSGKTMVDADSLSRNPVDEPSQTDEDVIYFPSYLLSGPGESESEGVVNMLNDENLEKLFGVKVDIMQREDEN